MAQQGRLERMKKGKMFILHDGTPVYFEDVGWGGTSPIVCMTMNGKRVCKTAAEWKRLGAKL